MPRKERERRYISEYMMETFPRGNWQLNVELGAIPAEYVQRYGVTRAAAIFRPTRPRVDAVHWEPDKYYIIESKVREPKSGIGELIYYRDQALIAPDLPFYDGQVLVPRLVVPFFLDWIVDAAHLNGIEVVIFKPDWINAYIEERQHYFTAEYRAKRAETMRLRNILGVE